jgi:hypothetical protein
VNPFLVDDLGSQLDLVGGDEIALPEFEGPAVDGRAVRDRAQDEAPVRLQEVVREELLPALQGQIGAVDEVPVEPVPLRVDVVDAVPILAIDDKEEMG